GICSISKRGPVDGTLAASHFCSMTQAPTMTSTPVYQIFSTEAGFCGIVWSEAGIVRFCLPAESREAVERHMLRRLPGAQPGEPPEHIRTAIALTQAYFTGEAVNLDALPLDLDSLSPAQQAIYTALRKVGRGETTTYGALATAAGMTPQAAREVG